MNTTQNDHKELLPFLGKSFKNISGLRPFLSLLEADPRPGVNDFSVPWHRDAYDYCDAQYIIIRHGGKQNIASWEWNQYSGYKVDVVSDIWFDEVFTDQTLAGTCESFRYNHWEYDYNSGRFCAGTRKTAVKVMLGGKYGFVKLSSYKSNRENPFFSKGPVFSLIFGNWHFDYCVSKDVIQVVKDGKDMLLTQDGVIIPLGRNLMQELKTAERTLKNKEDILREWIEKDKPCAYRCGFAYRGATARRITKDKARELLPNYSFGMGFYELCFELLGEPTLIFNEYSANDLY